jgi:hypothetical protein
MFWAGWNFREPADALGGKYVGAVPNLTLIFELMGFMEGRSYKRVKITQDAGIIIVSF